MADIPLSDLLRCAMQVVGRMAMRPEQIGEVVVVNGNAKQLKAYNLCDGTKTQAEVAKAAGLDQGNFSRTAGRWIESGVIFKLGTGREAKLLHLYPLVKGDFKVRVKRKTGGKRAGSRKKGAGRRKGTRDRASR
jgi:hypothetical protein